MSTIRNTRQLLNVSNLRVGDIVRTVLKKRRPTGGQSIPAFDYYMAPGVAKTFVKELYKVLKIRYPECRYSDLRLTDENGKLTNEGIKKNLKTYRENHRLILDRLEYVKSLIATEYCKELSPSEIDKVISLTMEVVEDATHQAMEAVIHNLNSMHCLPYSEKLWVYDLKLNTFKPMQIGQLVESFEINRYKVVSLNKKTGKAEFKFITAAKKMDNNRDIVTIINNQGAKVKVTTNHKIMTIDGIEITEQLPDATTKVITPRGIKTPMVNNDICIEGYGRVRKDSPYIESHVFVSEAFAELMGYYVADGSLLGDSGTLCLTTCGKVPFDELEELVEEVFGKTFNINTTYYDKDGVATEKDFRVGLGRRLTRMIEDKFGRGSRGKHIPIEIMFATDNIKEAFLRAYFRCDGRSNKKYTEMSTTSKELQLEIAFMLQSLGGSVHYATRDCVNGFDKTDTRIHTMHSLMMSAHDSFMVGLKDANDTAFSIPKYDLTMIPTSHLRESKNARYEELEELVDNGHPEYEHLLNIYINSVTDKIDSNTGDEYVYDISVKDNENFMTSEGIFVHNSRAGT